MKKEPFITLEQVRKIANKYPTPFYIYDEKGIRQRARAVNKAFSWNPGFKEYFAVKATPTPKIIDILKEEGCGVDCATYTELLLVNKFCKIEGDDIVFSSNVTPKEDFELAYKLGAIINFDDISYIDYYKSLGIPFMKKMCCRYNPGGSFKISGEIMGKPSEAKYGMTKEQIKQAYVKLREEGVKEFGIHAFLASAQNNNEYYPTLARELFELIVEIKNETGIEISFVDLSGGIGIPYKPTEEPVDIDLIGQGVKKEYDEILKKNGMEVSIYAELGRYMLAEYGALITQAIQEKKIYKDYIGVDACAANLMRPSIYGAYHHISVLGKENEENGDVVNWKTYDVIGGLCENSDKFAIDRRLPKIDIGDYLFIHDAGAHGFSMGYNYNGKLRSAEFLLKEDSSVEMIRRAETVDDYFATLWGQSFLNA